MLNTPAPFPQTGSYALHRVQGGTRLARIQHRDGAGDGAALISYPATPGASGNLTVDMSALIDGTPLTPEENAEFVRLGTAAVPTRRKDRDAHNARLAELGQRRIYSKVLSEMMVRAGLATRTLNAEDAGESCAA